MKNDITTEIEKIQEDTDKLELSTKLIPVIKKLAEMNEPEAEAYLTCIIQTRFKLTQKDVEAYRHMLRRYRKEKLRPEEGGENKKRIEYRALFEGLIDLVEDKGEPAFLIKDENKLFIKHSVEIDGVLYVPPPKDKIPWMLPRGENALKIYEEESKLPSKDVDKALFNDLVKYHKSVSELPADDYYRLLAAWVLHTYLLDKFQYSPLICLFAIPERGKSRTGKGMIYVAFRGIHVESLRDAYLVRMASYFQATVFFDVKDIWRKAEKCGSEDILLHRFERGATVARVLNPEKKPHEDMRYFSIFGATAIATNEGIHRILETRAIRISMPESNRQFDNEITKENSLSLKERLVAFKARHSDTRLADVPKPARGRLGDILKPLQQVMRLVKPEREEKFLRLCEELEKERLIEKAESLEAQILLAIMENQYFVEHGALSVKDITDELNAGKTDREKISYKRVGWVLKAMGFKKRKTDNGASEILWDRKMIEKLLVKYGLEGMPETPVTQELDHKSTEKADVSDDTGIFSEL